MRTELQNFINTIPAVADAAELKETFWLNDKKVPAESAALRAA